MVDLKPQKVSFYLKAITEGVLLNFKTEGTLRKEIWAYIMKTYKDDVDYYEFLLAVRKFTNEGKVINREGFYSMHPMVIEEFNKEKGSLKIKEGISSARKVNTQPVVSNKGISKSVASSGRSSPKQSKIGNYFMRRQLEPFGFENFNPNAKSQPVQRGLGWATPGAEPNSARSELIENRSDAKRANQALSAGGGSEQALSGLNSSASKTKPQQLVLEHDKTGIHAKRSKTAKLEAENAEPKQRKSRIVIKKTKIIRKVTKRVKGGKKSSTVKLETSVFTRQTHSKASAPPLINPSISEAIFNEIRSGGPPVMQEKNSGKRTGKRTTIVPKPPPPKKITKAIKKAQPKTKKVGKKIPEKKQKKMNLRGKKLDLRKLGVINDKKTPSKAKPTVKRMPVSKQSATKTPTKPKTPKQSDANKRTPAPLVPPKPAEPAKEAKTSKGKKSATSRQAKVDAANSIKHLFNPAAKK